MDQFEEYLEKEFIIWNPTFGVRDFTTISEIKKNNNITNIWMDDPYDMVGPLNLNELLFKGEIVFEACVVMTKENWQKKQNRLKKESYQKQQKIYKEFGEDIKKHNKKRKNFKTFQNEKKYRELLSLPLEEKLEISQIKTAYRKIAKTTHPDVGGDHERFVLITEAKDALLLIIC